MDDSWDEAAVDLYARFRAGQLTREDMAAQLPPIWRSRERLDPLGSAAAWRDMVDYAGYFTWRSGTPHGQRARRPWRRCRLYRGASTENRFGMSWTTNLAVARHFADHRQAPGAHGHVWVATFAPGQLLGYLHDEHEYLVNTTGATIRAWAT